MNQYKKYGFSFLFLLMAFGMIVPALSSCGKGAAVEANYNISLNIINNSPDVLPLDFFINFNQRGRTHYYYGIPSGYLNITNLALPLQLRNGLNQTVLQRDTALSPNVKYTWIVTGFKADLKSIFTADTSAAPKTGFSKIRFVHASPLTAGLDVFANGTIAFKNLPYLGVSKFLEMPAGNYDLKIYATGTTNLLSNLTGTTLQDGRLYTIYTRGIAGRADSSAFTAGVITNR